MDTTVAVALITAAAAMFTAVFGSIAAAKLRREERRAQSAEIDAEAERKARDQVIEHYRGLVSDLVAENARLRARGGAFGDR